MNKKNPVCAGAVIRNKIGKYLLVLGKEAEKWGFPKGHIEENEDWKECAKRETFEETGLRIDIPDKKCKYCFTPKSVYYLLKTENIIGENNLCIKDSVEIGDIGWFSKKDLFRMKREQVNMDLWDFIRSLKWLY